MVNRAKETPLLPEVKLEKTAPKIVESAKRQFRDKKDKEFEEKVVQIDRILFPPATT